MQRSQNFVRIALGVEYDGSRFHGWQTQADVPTVQEALEAALSKVADHPLTVHCAGRTDAGVHGYGQVVHFDTRAYREPRAWVLGGNMHAPPGLSVQWAQAMPEHFHARFSARRRRYRYVILNRSVRPAVLHRRVSFERKRLDAEAMHRAGQCLLGEQDFSAFRAAACQSERPVRTLHRLEVTRNGDFIALDVEANAFLHHMVRNIAGTLIAVGRGERPASWVAEVLESADRRRAGPTAPPDGLYFMGVGYPEEFSVPENDAPVLFV